MTKILEKQGPESMWPALILFGSVAVMIALDLAADASEGAPALHLLPEGLGAAAALAGVAWSWARIRESRRRDRLALAEARSQERAWRAEAERWRGEAQALLDGLGRAIDQQFERWGLTRSEAEVALLLLKGLSHKEIAAVRQTGERTARQHARAVYRKAGLGGRAELAAFFLEDLLLPMPGKSPQADGPGGA